MADFLVAGALGQVGQELRRHVGSRDAVFVDRATLDIGDAAAVTRCIATLKPRVVLNAAAYTAVDKAESEPELAHQINSLAPGYLARACAEAGAALLHLSTDYVFDGNGTQPWREDDPVAPLSVYGASKLGGEIAVRTLLNRHVILRTAWVVSPFRGNFVKTMLRLAAERDELRVVADQFGGPTMAADIAAACWRIADRIAASPEPAHFGTFHFAGQPHVSWHDFACAIIAESARHGGRQPRVTAITTAEYPLPAPRPANSRLDGAKLERVHGIAMPDWRQSLVTLIDELYSVPKP
ncbi:dTDP-4-dehydrorhamnose reductase [Ferrovibrio sp.]|uniref:dTDP-4-dehydrorhamnose reductase n=1 Tax=Ferrovibrio sp. TaxID=1917215 RepID=UPI003D0CF22A